MLPVLSAVQWQSLMLTSNNLIPHSVLTCLTWSPPPCLQVCDQEEVLELDAHSLGELLALDELNVSAEQQVLELVMRWARRRSGDPQSEAEAAQVLLRRVRLELVEPQFLHEARRRNPVGEPHRVNKINKVLSSGPNTQQYQYSGWRDTIDLIDSRFASSQHCLQQKVPLALARRRYRSCSVFPPLVQILRGHSDFDLLPGAAARH